MTIPTNPPIPTATDTTTSDNTVTRDELVELHQRCERLTRDAVLAAQARNQAVCDLYDGDEWTHQRIADLLGITVGRVGQIVRAHAKPDG